MIECDGSFAGAVDAAMFGTGATTSDELIA